MKRAPILIPSIRPHRFRKYQIVSTAAKGKTAQSLQKEDLQKLNTSASFWNETNHSIGENRNLKSA